MQTNTTPCAYLNRKTAGNAHKSEKSSARKYTDLEKDKA